MLFIVVRMKFHAERNFARRKPMNDIAGFGVPQFQITIVAGRHKLRSLIVEAHIFDRLSMSNVRANASSFAVHFPQFDATIHAARQQQMCRFRDESNGRNAFRVSRPTVYVRFGQETFVRRRVRSQIDANVVRCMQKRTSLIVQRIFDCTKKKKNK